MIGMARRPAWWPCLTVVAVLMGRGPAMAEGTRGATPALSASPAEVYVDRVIEGISADDDDAATAVDTYNREGWPRFLRLESRWGSTAIGQDRKTRSAVAVSGLLETPNHGSLSIDGSLAAKAPTDSADGAGIGRSTLTFRQRGIPLEGDALLHWEAGIIDPPQPRSIQRPSRVALPNTLMQGASVEWEQPGHGVQLQLARGAPGRLTSFPIERFVRDPGSRTTFSGEWALGQTAAPDETPPNAPQWTLAWQHERAQDVASVTTWGTGAPIGHAQSSLLTLHYAADDLQWQARVVRSQSHQDANAPLGYWVDGEWGEQTHQQRAGLYRLDTRLTWAGLTMPNDLAGLYYRSAWRTRQWSAEGSIDWLRSLSGQQDDGVYLTGSSRWRLGRDNHIGVGLAVRRFQEDAWSTYADWRLPTPWGISGYRLELNGGSRHDRAARTLSYDQEWHAPVGWTVTSSLALSRFDALPTEQQPAETAWSGALSFGGPLGSRSMVRANLGTERGSNGRQRHHINAGATWKLDQQWSIEGNLYRATGRARSNRPLDPLAPPTIDEQSFGDRSFYLVLRYDMQAGSRDVPLGGKPRDGGGRIEGVVFFDANRNGNQEASEKGVPNAMVALDNRYAVRTDAQGRFEFPFVASGTHSVSVRNDTLPLPWGTADGYEGRIDLRLRDTVRLSIPVQQNN